MIPMRANIVGPPDVATRIKASIAACHSAASCSGFGSFPTIHFELFSRSRSASIRSDAHCIKLVGFCGASQRAQEFEQDSR
jgi:hypothetical protein